MKPIKIISTFAIMISALIIVSWQGKNHEGNMMTKPMMAKIQKAICVLYPTVGNKVMGIITFTQADSGIKVVANIQGLSKGKHGFHIHECGDCSAPNASSAGGHFNPAEMQHGAPTDIMRHAGDLGNVVANDSGKVHFEFIDNMLSFEGEYSIIGRSVIVHKDADDLKSQPAGNSGSRVACGVIGISK
jgi:Cu-Zn family superoxide dismutase